MENKKQDHMALIAIVGIVAIVGLFLMFFSQGTKGVPTGINGDLSGQAIRGVTKAGIEGTYKVDWTSCNGLSGQALSDCMRALFEEVFDKQSGYSAGIEGGETDQGSQAYYACFTYAEEGGMDPKDTCYSFY